MLELINIKKEYPAGDGAVQALRGVDLRFRKNEFVSILGPSGCGKTTMLNIIGGLDQYTEGDLVINGKSTKDFKDRDWDAYRNHSIGFVFQSYNLIPHQTVLQNVELALTLSGVSKAERRERAKKALDDVGLSSQLYKKPSEMSGGQMQRVAIARALVNDPDIILADEPTGALDTVTSVQVMDILKEISKDKLIIMVTHNPELAEKYSSRIIRILDGEITADSNPLSEDEYAAETEEDKKLLAENKKVKKPSMSFTTAFSLSLKNLLTKKGRTMLTSFAGSIGIIGIALILALSQGVTMYIDTVQENALSSYPLTIESKVMDMSSLFEAMLGQGKSSQEHDKDAVYTKPIIYDLVNAMSSSNQSENDLKSFKQFIDSELADENSELYGAVSGVQYSYDLDLLVYTKNVDGDIILSDPNRLMQELMQEAMGIDISSMVGMRDEYLSSSGMGSMFSTRVVLWQEMLPADNGELVSDILKEQYDVIYGEWPDAYDEIVLVVDRNNELDDLTLYALGLESKEQMLELTDAAMNQGEAEPNIRQWSYEDICGMEFRTVLNSSCYSYDPVAETYSDLRESETGMKFVYDNGIPLKVTGIIRANEDADATMLSGSIGYTSALTDYVIENSKDSDAVNAQLGDTETDIFTGLPFKSNDEEELTAEDKSAAFKEYIGSLNESEKAEAYVKILSVPTDEEIAAAIEQTVGSMSRDEMIELAIQQVSMQMTMDEETLREYLSSMSDEEFNAMLSQAMADQMRAQKAAMTEQQTAAMSAAELSAGLKAAMETFTAEQCALYYDEIIPQEYSDSSYESNLLKLGYIDLDTPSSINLYASTFENKDIITSAIDKYNASAEEEKQITYTDYIGIMMSSMTTIINSITYVLIAFVAISLIVSSIMIGVITLISVQERTKEIGILRAIGASKRDVSSMFNAETMIIGFTSGLLGVLVSYLLCIPINIVIHAITDINSLNAYLPIPAAVILTLISVGLTLFSGLIPSRSAAKKDPVVALRTE